MPEADVLDGTQGQPFSPVLLRAISEGLIGNGTVSPGDLNVTATATDLEISVASGSAFYGGSVVSLNTPPQTFVLASGDGTYDRWDTVYFDTSTGDAGVRQGTAEQYPAPPDITGSEILLAVVYVEQNATNVQGADILNWRAAHQDAGGVRLIDAAGDYSSSTVEGGFTEVLRNAGGPLTGEIDLSSFAGGSVLDLGTNPGAFGPVVDAVIDNNSAQGNAHTYGFALDGSTILEVYAESDGSGGVQNLRTNLPQGARLLGDLADDQGNTYVDYATGTVPAAVVATLSLGSDTDTDLAGNDLTDSSGPGALYSAASGEFDRGVLDDELSTVTVTSSTFSTGDQELVLVDTATIAAASTITLSSSDVEAGHTVTVMDVSGSARSYPITVDTGGTESIEGRSSIALTAPYEAVTFAADGTDWKIAGGSPVDPAVQVEGTESGSVGSGGQGTVIVDHLKANQTLEIRKAIHLRSDGQAHATGVDMIIATLDNAGAFSAQVTIFSGDGSTIWDGDPANSVGDPLASYSPSAATTVAVLVDNTTASAYDVMAKATGRIR